MTGMPLLHNLAQLTLEIISFAVLVIQEALLHVQLQLLQFHLMGSQTEPTP